MLFVTYTHEVENPPLGWLYQNKATPRETASKKYSQRDVQRTEVWSLGNPSLERFSQNKMRVDLPRIRAYKCVKILLIILKK